MLHFKEEGNVWFMCDGVLSAALGIPCLVSIGNRLVITMRTEIRYVMTLVGIGGVDC